MITKEQLLKIMPLAGERAKIFLEPLNETMQEFDISTPLRQAAFLAQIAHESSQLRYVKELASGRAYEGRVDLGNTEKGDGVKFKGRGLPQITGRDNYLACGKALGIDLILHPDWLEIPAYAARSAGWFWNYKGLSPLADIQDFVRITKRINGGRNGLEQRQAFYEEAKTVLGCQS